MLNKDFFKVGSNKIEPVKGDVLVAEPFLHGKYFGRSVVLITEGSEESTMGLVLNKPLTYDVSNIVYKNLLRLLKIIFANYLF